MTQEKKCLGFYWEDVPGNEELIKKTFKGEAIIMINYKNCFEAIPKKKVGKALNRQLKGWKAELCETGENEKNAVLVSIINIRKRLGLAEAKKK